MTRLRLWGFSWRLLLGFAVVIIIAVVSFSALLLGRLESYLLHDMEDSMANQARMAKGSIEFALQVSGVQGIDTLSGSQLYALQRLTRRLAVQTGCRILVTDANGTDLIDSAGTSLEGTRLTSDEFTEAIESGYGAHTRVDPLSHQYSMYVAYPITTAAGLQGVIRISRPTSAVSTLLGTIEKRIVISGVIAGGAAILVSVVFAFVLARPIRKIREAAVRFGRGDLEARSGLAGHGDLAELSRSFDRMADRIERTVVDLSELDELKSDFVANVSHELKTPLTAIRGLSETLLDGALDDTGVNRQFVTDIAAEAERLLVMVNNLLNLARIEAGALEVSLETLDVTQLVDGIVERFATVADNRSVSLALLVEAGAGRITGDRAMLDQALANVLDNAVKYSPPGGEVRVAVFRNPDDPGKVSISVSDDGPGIDDEDLEHVFERFYRGRGTVSRTGSGIGLTIAARNLDMMEGVIAIDTTSRPGTTVTITLPAA